ncbi:FHA domain-containing protein [Ktedonobacter racemifer]|uniref:FHA domain containing protein n=1 Tax=Ktedonobacter racemifer DSM 44963 TaxID=485913 RepID=D6U182_KTERA|nr:FHA domain-containing protein [Ktedonobacter racemifer]EFH82572.1 FHA domain containing protein [Ktedonobacter racemifer DSM 44963]
MSDVIHDPDFLALGLGGTNMMAMLWAVAMGRTAIGVEMRGDPFLGVHWNIREDFYHQLGLIDQLMLERHGEARLPRRGDGRLFRLAECFYSPHTSAGDIVADEIIDGFDADQHIVGTIHNVEFIDDRWRDGLPNRVITVLEPPKPPEQPDPRKIRTSMVEVLDGPSTFQAEAASIQKLLRRYLELIEQKDRETNSKPRVQLFTHHRVVPKEGEGFIDGPDGRKRIRIEALKEFDFKGQFVRVREPNSEIIDLGVPELFMVAQGFNSTDAKRLGFEQHDVEVDHGDGYGPVVAQADFLAGLVEVLVGGRLRRRISSAFDQNGKEYWVRQIAVGHENDPEVGWVLVQVPDFTTFDPIEAGLLPAGTDSGSPEFFGSYQHLIYDYYIKQAAEILDIPRQELKKVQMIYGPTLFSLVERVGDDPLIAVNGVVAGDSFGNGHFLTSGGAMTGMIGHSARVLEYWQARDRGTVPTDAIRRLAERIKEDTHAWLQVSAQEYSQAAPINFGAERIEQISKASGIDISARASAIDAARRQRHALIPLDPSNWRRLFVRNGRVLSVLPELEAEHPLQRPEHVASLLAVMKSFPTMLSQTSEKLKRDEELAGGERTILRTRSSIQHDLAEGEQTLIRPKFRIGPVAPESAKTYAFLDMQHNGQAEQRIAIKGDLVVVGRADPKHNITPGIDLTSFDTSSGVSRQHAQIRIEQTRFSIEDLNSRNKTRLGELVLTPHKPEILQDGDVVSFGSVKATFRVLGASELPEPWSPS